MITEPLFYALAIPAVIALGISKGGFSGLGTIAAPLIALAVPPIQAVAVLIPILLVQDAVTVWAYRKTWDANILKIMIPGQVVGVLIAWAFAAYVADSVIRLVVGAIAILFCFNQWFGLARRAAEQTPKTTSNPVAGAVAGAFSGFTSFVASSGAPPFQVYVIPKKLPKEVFVGTFSIFFASGNAMKVAPYFMLGQFSPELLKTAAVLLPLAVAANLAGVWLVRRTPVELFYRIIYVLIFLIGCELIRQGLVALWR